MSRHHTTHPILLVCGAVLTFCAGLSASAITDDWTWFQRSGSILALFGILMISHRYVRTSGLDARREIYSNLIEEVRKNMGKEPATADFEDEFIDRTAWQLIDDALTRFGIGTAVLGTLIWGWGDLLRHVF